MEMWEALLVFLVSLSNAHLNSEAALYRLFFIPVLPFR
jgi:hypothetical protein